MTQAQAPRLLVMCVFRCSFEDRERMRALARHRGEPYGKILRELVMNEFNTLPVDVRYTASSRALAEEDRHAASAAAEGV